MEESPLLQKAKSQIQSVKSRTLSLEERKEAAIALAGLMLEEAQRIQTASERRQQEQLARMMNDPIGKVFTTAITDQCFRSQNPYRVADQLTYVIKKYGVPKYLTTDKRLALKIFTVVGRSLSRLIVPLTIQLIRKETTSVILPGEEDQLAKHMQKRRQEGVRINLNHLGEAILGEEEAQHRLQIYLDDLAKPEVEYISVKISTIYSQINLLAWEETLDILADRLRQLYRAAKRHLYIRPDEKAVPKFVNLDMEEYRDLNLTVALFRKVLDESEFYQYEAGIVLQSYLPDSYLIQQELTIWAMQRLARGGAPIKIRIVKGANLAMEQFESALRLWPQAPYSSKADVDANYKRMVTYGCEKDHAQAAHLGIASHNLFDIAYAMLLRSEKGVEKEVCFEMLEGMADHMRRVVQYLSGDMLLYCPAATKAEFQNAVAYLVRRLDENTAPENFLRHAFDLKPGTEQWQNQADLFARACLNYQTVSYLPRRTQNRLSESAVQEKGVKCFQNEPDTDWSLPQNRKWAEKIMQDWKAKKIKPVPLVIGGNYYGPQGQIGKGEDPAQPGEALYQYTLATEEQVDHALKIAQENEKGWSQTSIQERAHLLAKIAQNMCLHRGDLIGAMVADTGKTIAEADIEVSEAIDFATYYSASLLEWGNLADIKWKPKGTILVAPPWNFPCSIPAGGILAALATGNCVIFKPAAESVLVGWQLVQLFWEAGISQSVLQFITCEDDPVGSRLIRDPRIAAVVLTGATSTAKLFLKMRPDLDLMAETGGKNTLVITAMSDRDLAIKDLVHSAFGHAGQKCSACSLAILEAEVYDDPHFRKQLRDAAASLAVGSQWDLKTRVNPLIRAPNPTLLQGLTQLEEGEEWLLEPKQDPNNPQLWSPGIKLGVRPGSFTFQNELFGPVLGLVRAETFAEALDLMNQTAYGLTAGIHSLDEREQREWLSRIEAGNCYINRTITGAIVERQPFGGCKESSFGKGSKAGGPNYLVQFMHAEQTSLPQEGQEPKGEALSFVNSVGQQSLLPSEDVQRWQAAVKNYAFYYNRYFSKAHDPSLVMGQDNLQCYKPRSHLLLRGQQGDALIDLLLVMAAALICSTQLEVSIEDPAIAAQLHKLALPPSLTIVQETEQELIKRLEKGRIKRVRLLRSPSQPLQEAFAQAACHLNRGPVLANGRLELLHLLREVSISRDYHRYGNLGDRENEPRHPLPGSPEEQQMACGACACHE
ncbi:bifunctional proline dehydrogenase/L-glutamate gamma-semialdehyde dehydrogenase [Candidatus Protochlamydia phocaeensis]|uniref:bifunctional proline dehydrogenase/L-glutamate gamma-semialdehyde dehydrogenase n=1 Tax=Candidatus Protochlamydia phocaeensis TaxID=1414722 RepID=UPI0008389D08|nr:proline dehydrogenase family protein [Candidatus Protochlamydia phocaeensis]